MIPFHEQGKWPHKKPKKTAAEEESSKTVPEN